MSLYDYAHARTASMYLALGGHGSLGMNTYQGSDRISSQAALSESTKAFLASNGRLVSYGLLAIILAMVMAIESVGFSHPARVLVSVPVEGTMHAFRVTLHSHSAPLAPVTSRKR